jgi:DNA-directed RNA polymerase subunit RPC12/RpoP
MTVREGDPVIESLKLQGLVETMPCPFFGEGWRLAVLTGRGVDVAAELSISESETQGTSEPMCPRCGKERPAWQEDFIDAQHETTIRCGHCGTLYRAELHVEPTFYTSLQDDQ